MYFAEFVDVREFREDDKGREEKMADLFLKEDRIFVISSQIHWSGI